MLTITIHAITKYISEMEKKGVCGINNDRACEDIACLFENADLEDDNPGLIRRIIDNEFEEAKYYRNGDWRMVVCDNSIVTIEINRFKPAAPGYISKNSLLGNKRKKKYVYKVEKKEKYMNKRNKNINPKYQEYTKSIHHSCGHLYNVVTLGYKPSKEKIEELKKTECPKCQLEKLFSK